MQPKRESEMSNYRDSEHSQKKREALFQGGAGQYKPSTHIFINNKLVPLTEGTDASALMNMGIANPNQTSLNREYGIFKQSNVPVPDWMQQKKVFFLDQRVH